MEINNILNMIDLGAMPGTYFTDVDDFKSHVREMILALEPA